MSFSYPDLLWIGGVVVLLVLFGSWRQARRRSKLGAFLGGRRAAIRLSAASLFRLRLDRVMLLAVGGACLGLAAAEPFWPDRQPEPPPPPLVRSVVIAIDVSASMQAADLRPTRLARGVELARELIESLESERVGLLLFAGESYPLAPPTHDHRVLHFLLDGLTATIASAHDPGTLISTALESATAMLDRPDDAETQRTVVLITDGGAGEPEGSVLAAGARARADGIAVHVIGTGSEAGSRMVMPRAQFQLGGPILGPDGAPVISRIRQPLLRNLAESGGGSYAYASDEGQVASLMASFRRPAVAPVAEVVRPLWAEYDLAFLFAVVGLLCLLLESLFDARLPRLAPQPRRRIA